MLPLSRLLGADGQPLNMALTNVTGKPLQVEPGSKTHGDPEKTHHVHIDDRGASPASLLTGGAAYTPSKKEVAGMAPTVICPMCGITCIGFTDAVPEFQLKDTPQLLRRYVYRSERCGCMVTQEWVAAINAELNHRTTGGQPQQVEEISPTRRKMLYDSLEKEMHAIMDKLLLVHASERADMEQQLAAYLKVMGYLGVGLQEITDRQAAEAAAAVTTNIQFGGMSSLAKTANAIQKINAMKQAQLDKAVADAGLGYSDKYPAPKATTAKIDENIVLDQTKKILEKTAEAMGYVPPPLPASPLAQADAQAKLASRPIPSPERLAAAEARLTAVGWEATIGAAFKNLTRAEERLQIRDIILDSIQQNRTAEHKVYHPAVDKLIYHLFAVGKPTAYQGTPQATKPVTGKPPTPATQQAIPPVITPTVTPEQFHEQFKKKKRKIKQLPPSEET